MGSTLTASATKQAGDVERGYCDVTKGAGAIPVGTTILVQQNEAQPSVLSKYQVGPAVVTESLYEQLPSLSTTTIASEVPYISLDEFLADETTSTPSSSINEVKQTDLTCNVPRPTRGQTVPYTIQPLARSSTKTKPWDTIQQDRQFRNSVFFEGRQIIPCSSISVRIWQWCPAYPQPHPFQRSPMRTLQPPYKEVVVKIIGEGVKSQFQMKRKMRYIGVEDIKTIWLLNDRVKLVDKRKQI